MKDPIIEQVWKNKEKIASTGKSDFKKLSEYIKKEAGKIEDRGPTINLQQKKSA